MSDSMPRFTGTEMLLIGLGLLGLVGTWAQGFSYLAHRQRRIRQTRPAEATQPAGSDWIAIGIAVLIVLVAVGYSLRHIP